MQTSGEPQSEVTALSFERSDVEQTIQARFEQVAEICPGHLALTGRGQRWTYDALNRRANQVAHAIRARTPPGAGCVAYLLGQSPDIVVAALAVLKAGKSCVAVHPRTPSLAQGQIIRNASPDLILTSRAFEEQALALADGLCGVLTIEGVAETAPTANPPALSRSHDPAIILYTSGSTGQPKGVVWSHRGMLHRVWIGARQGAVAPTDRQSLLTHSSFSAAQTEVFDALLNGAAVCVFDVVSEGLTALQSWLADEQITLLRMPLALFRRFVSTCGNEERFPSVRVVNVGGDTVLPADVERWKQHFLRPSSLSVRFSATETGRLTTLRFDHDTVLGPEGARAGYPVAEKKLTVIDDEGRAVPNGDEGQLVVTSAFLADGYWQRPEETARAFTPDQGDPDQRSYRTGDRGRLLPDGRFEFLGRNDQQVKIRGYRVEIREVETVLLQLEGVREAAVVADKTGDETRLLAFVAMRSGAAGDAVALRTHLRSLLPEWKIPACFFAMESLPTTLSGKVDRQRLKELALGREVEPSTAAAPTGVESPRDALEIQIAQQWQALLKCGPVGRSDDFFFLGGDSLRATVLHLHLERLMGAQIPLQLLFESPTVTHMAAVVRRATLSDPPAAAVMPSVLVPIRRAGQRVPLFLVPGGMGRPFVRPRFLDILGSDQPVYGFQSSGLDRAMAPRRTFVAMAREYVRAMRAVQPTGPYFLGAACAGALVAIEMANQLRQAGEALAPLLLFDPPATPLGDLPWWRRYRRMLRAHLRVRLPHRLWQRLGLEGPDTARRFAKVNASIDERVRRVEEDPGRDDLWDDMTLGSGLRATLEFDLAGLRHTHWNYDGPVLVFRSRERLNGAGSDRGTFGGHLRGDVQWIEAGSSHSEVVGVRSELAASQLQRGVSAAREALEALRRGPGPSSE